MDIKISKIQKRILEENNLKLNVDNGQILIYHNDGTEIPMILFAEQETKIISSADDYFEYVIAVFKSGSSSAEHIIFSDKEMINCDETVLKRKFGCKSITDNSSLLIKILTESCKVTEEKTIYNFNGWGGDAGNRYFICGSQKITQNRIENISNNAGKVIYTEDVSIAQACEFVNNTYLQILNNSLYAQIMLCYSVLANIHQLILDAGSVFQSV